MITITVKLFSTLRKCVPDYDPERGIALDLPSGATVESVLGQLGIPDSKQPFVTCQGRVLKLTDQAPIGGTLHIFQPVAGG